MGKLVIKLSKLCFAIKIIKSFVNKNIVKTMYFAYLHSSAKSLGRNQLRIMTGLLIGHCHLKRHLFKLGLVNSPKCDRCKKASEAASHVLCDREALTTLTFRHPGCHFKKPGDLEDISVSKILHFAQDERLMNERAKGLHKRSIKVEVYRSLWCPPFCILFHSILLALYSEKDFEAFKVYIQVMNNFNYQQPNCPPLPPPRNLILIARFNPLTREVRRNKISKSDSYFTEDTMHLH
jgi:hypothetical protein